MAPLLIDPTSVAAWVGLIVAIGALLKLGTAAMAWIFGHYTTPVATRLSKLEGAVDERWELHKTLAKEFHDFERLVRDFIHESRAVADRHGEDDVRATKLLKEIKRQLREQERRSYHRSEYTSERFARIEQALGLSPMRAGLPDPPPALEDEEDDEE